MPRLLALLPLLIWLMRPVIAPAWWWRWDAGLRWVSTTMLGLGLMGIIMLVAYASLRKVQAERRSKVFSRWLRPLRKSGTILLCAWFAVCIWLFGWPATVFGWIEPDGWSIVELSVATGPVYLAWAALLAADWPAVRHRFERRMLIDIELGYPPIRPPRFTRWWMTLIRTSLGVTLAPLLVFWLVKDLTALVIIRLGYNVSADLGALILIGVGMTATVALSPWLLSRVLPTRPLGAGEPGSTSAAVLDLARTIRMHRRGIVRVWDTDNATANALAIGFLPGLRYILLSDLLLGGLSPPQGQAVFAHEVGHIRHRHMAWFIAFFLTIALFLIGPVDAIFTGVTLPGWADWSVSLGLLVGVIFGFGWLSRTFERQADVFAARLMQDQHAGVSAKNPGAVGSAGAWAFAGALRSALRLNGGGPREPQTPTGDYAMALRSPVASRITKWVGWVRPAAALENTLEYLLRWSGHFLHGSYLTRTSFLDYLALDPSRTVRFERRVLLIKSSILAMGLVSLIFCVG